jgi:ribonuclease P protein component
VDRICVLVVLKNGLPYSRAGFTASRRVGKATKRNRARRLMKEVVRRHFDEISPGWDLVFVARPPIVNEGFASVERSILRLLDRAGVLRSPDAGEGDTSGLVARSGV